MHVTLVSGFDATKPSAGGTRTHVESLLAFLRQSQIPSLLITGGIRWEVAEDRCTLPVRRPNSTFAFQAALCSMLPDLPIPEDSIIHAHRPDDLLPVLLHRIGIGRICTLHGNPARYVPSRHGRLVSALYGVAERLALRHSDQVLTVDTRTASEYGAKYSWLRGRVRTIPNGIDTIAFHSMDRSRAKQVWGVSGCVFLYAGRLEPDKNVRQIVQAFRTLRNSGAVLLIAGDGGMRRVLEVDARGLDVRFLGPIARSEMPSLINAADAGVLFSDEGLSSFALEALSCGVPLIATPTGGLSDVVRPGENGYLVSTPEELVGAMAAVLRGAILPNPSLAEAVYRYAWPIVGKELLAVYRDVWSGRDA